jgi:hypothetical protein
MAWNDFYIQPSASDLNAGSTTDNAALWTYAAGTFVRATGVFTTAGGNPQTDGVTTAMWASVYTTAGATGTTFAGKVLARDATTVTLDVATLKIGVATNVSEGAGATTCKIGGAWTSLVVVTSLFVAQTMTMNARINIKAGTYANAATARSFAAAGTTLLPIWWRGYKATIGDLDDGVTIARSLQDGVNLPLITFTTGQMTIPGAYQLVSNIDITSQQIASANGGVYITGGNVKVIRSRIENTAADANARAVKGETAAPLHLLSCRIKSTTTATASLDMSITGSIFGCHVIGGAIGIICYGSALIIDCVVESFGTSGIRLGAATSQHIVSRCSIYAAATNAIRVSTIPTTGQIIIANTIMGGCTNGINNDTGGNTNGIVQFRNHFYSCTNNLVGITEMAAFDDALGILSRLIDNDTDPWVAKASSDFTLALTNNIDRTAGFPGVFEGQTVMVGYPDIGAVSRFNQPHFGDKSGGKY